MELQNNIVNLARNQGYIGLIPRSRAALCMNVVDLRSALLCSVMAAISGRGICFVTRDQHGDVVTTPFIPYEDVLHWESTPTTTSLTLSMGARREVLDIKCDFSSDVVRTLEDYVTVLTSASEWARYHRAPLLQLTSMPTKGCRDHQRLTFLGTLVPQQTTRPKILHCCLSAWAT